MSVLRDAAARRDAIDPARSFIVQAPAGSGKTGLLIQRVLALLATVEQPEEVIAITFTRKATGEMRERVLEALAAAREQPQPEQDHPRTTWTLARAVNARAAARGWDLERQPARLRILTIDALCGWLARQLMLRSGLPGDGAIADDAEPLHAEAAAQTLALIDEPASWAGAVARVLEHLDNDAGRMRRLLAGMLARRDQWLRLIGAGSPDEGRRRAMLEDAIERLVARRLRRLRASVPEVLAGDIVSLCAYAGDALARSAPEEPGAACAGLAALPGVEPDALAHWTGIASILLTTKGALRKRHTVGNGFPATGDGAREMKARADALCAALAGHGPFVTRLHEARGLPPTRYSDEQWAVLDALVDTLKLSAASLRVVFGERGTLDHPEIAAAARLALGAEEDPSDLALMLDHRIRHLLVDEFQDTSHAQFDLLGALTEGWTDGDGRTLFLVGDPMQSIYRFREADVGLFEHARRNGIGQIRLAPLALEANFRSRPAVIDWVNERFPAILGDDDDPSVGAVAYRPSVAVREPAAGSGVDLHLLEQRGDGAQARFVARLAGAALHEARDVRVAILVRARSHLAGVLEALRAEGIAYRGVDVEPLEEMPAVRDLVSLVSAAFDPLDRVAWLAALRAPWCGLALADLLALVDGAPRDVPILRIIEDGARLAALGPGARERVERLREPLAALVEATRRGRLARALERFWQTVGGPACVDAQGLAAADRLLDLLHRTEPLVLERGPAELQRQVGSLFADPAAESPAVEVMTMHKAKGLEFDTVILPDLARRPPADSRALLEWTSQADGPGGGDLLLAPLPSARGEEPALYEFVRSLERRKTANETARVLYVAATRARERLVLVGEVRLDEEQVVAPPAQSLLALLWPGIEAAGTAGVLEQGPLAGESPGPLPADAGPWRLPGDWQAPPPPASVSRPDGPDSREGDAALDAVEFDWAGRLARHVGTVVHAMMGEVAREGADRWTHGRMRDGLGAYRVRLRALGVSDEDASHAARRVEEILGGLLADPRARWLLDPGHEDASCELALAGVIDGAVVRGVLDRTFVDADGTRWVVDYKTGRHEGGDVDAFLDREQQRYEAQLERYGRLASALGDAPVRLALYYPAFGGWREWSAEQRP